MFSTAASKAKLLWAQLRRKGWRYWLTVAVLVTVGTLAGMWLGERYLWIRLRYTIYGSIQNATQVTKAAKNTVLVLIDDDEYWKGALARRVPLKRDYLACLVETLAQGEPATIALDIDLRSPNPEKGPEELEPYRVETELLLKAIKDVAQSRPVVLATSVTTDETGSTINPNVFDDYDFAGAKVTHGYVTLPLDLRQVPLSIPLKNRSGKENSFAGAIAKTREESLVLAAEQYEHRGFPYGSFYRPEEFRRINTSTIFNAGEQELKNLLGGRIVIVGGAWHAGSYKGPRQDYSGSIDLHFTPAGNVPGAFVHANYVEALLSGLVHPQVPEMVTLAIEVFCSLMVAVVFALPGSLRRKFGRVLLLSIVLVIISYFFRQNLGLFFDFFIPILLLSFHAPIEQLRETRAELRGLRARVRELEDKNTLSVEPTEQEVAVV